MIFFQDFSTVESLANYLKLLDENETLYEQYKWWTNYYQIIETKKNKGFLFSSVSRKKDR